MSRPRKYQKGRKLCGIHDLVTQIAARRYVFWRDRPCHPSWLVSVQLQTPIHLAASGAFSVAEPVEPEAHKEAAE